MHNCRSIGLGVLELEMKNLRSRDESTFPRKKSGEITKKMVVLQAKKLKPTWNTRKKKAKERK